MRTYVHMQVPAYYVITYVRTYVGMHISTYVHTVWVLISPCDFIFANGPVPTTYIRQLDYVSNQIFVIVFSRMLTCSRNSQK